MKITCQSCGAKYTISDEKVRGRTVKIRCKKCSSAIMLTGPQVGAEGDNDAARAHGQQASAEAMAGATQPPTAYEEWTLSISDGDQRAVTVDEIRRLMGEGTVTEDTYAWRDGMDDWLPIAQIRELADAVSTAGPSRRPARSEPVRPDPKLAGGLFGAAPVGGAARVGSPRPRTQDLFGAAQASPPETAAAPSAPSLPGTGGSQMPKPLFTAERGENSVLFTIDAIRAVGKGSQSAPSPAATEEEKIDLAKLATLAPPRIDSNPSSGLDDIMAMGRGGGFGQATLAAPTLPTSPPPPEPEPEPEPVHKPFDAPAKDNTALVIGLVAAVALLLFVSLSFGGYLLLRGEDEPVASNAESNAAASPDKAGQDNGVKPDEPPKDEDTADKDTADKDTADKDTADKDTTDKDADDKKTAADEDGKKATSDKAGASEDSKAGAAKGSGLVAATTKPDPKKEDKAPEKKEDKAVDTKDEPAPAAAAVTAPFSRSAAISALGAAAGAASGCKKAGGPTGRGRVSVTFAPSGRVTTAVVNEPPFAGTSVGGCVASAFRRASVPPFAGSPVTVHKSFSIQ